MLASFVRHYLELPEKPRKVVCLGGGVGTAQVLKGLRDYPYQLTAIVSMADDGGSAGRLRRAFSVLPPGDLVNCLTALSSEESVLNLLFRYRFAGKRYGKDTDLSGQKLGNLIFVALTDIYKGDTNKALEEFSKIISPSGRVLPATIDNVNIWAKNKDGQKVYGEQNIDLGKFPGSKALKEVHIDPEGAKAYKVTIEAIREADVLIAGPGDLFTTILPVLIVSQIKKEFIKSKAKKIFILNTTNKSFETPNFRASDYLETIEKHVQKNIFDKILINTNYAPKIPKGLKYKYVQYDRKNLLAFGGKILEGDFINTSFPLYHDSLKIAKAIEQLI